MPSSLQSASLMQSVEAAALELRVEVTGPSTVR